jgi:DNA mismatch repair ATPase MutS
MAGLPISVVQRAEEVLDALENRTSAPKRVVKEVAVIIDDPGIKPLPNKLAESPAKTQLSLFG